jgi:lipopolysaccharide export system protein LptC
MTRRMLLLLAFVALLVVVTGWLSRKSEIPAPGDSEAARNLPDYFMRDIESLITDKSGRASHRLNAVALFHYPQGDLSKLEQPDVTVLSDTDGGWHASAVEGAYRGTLHELRLDGDVRVTQRGEREMRLLTETLTIDTQRNYAETAAAVTLEGPASRLQGVGMQLYGDEQRLLLLSEVRGRYAEQ